MPRLNRALIYFSIQIDFMRIARAALFLLILTASLSFAESPKEQSVVIDINEDGSSTWEVVLRYSNATDKSDFFVIAYIKNVEVYGENKTLDCQVMEQGFGTLIACGNIMEKTVRYRFTAHELVRNIRTAKMFSYPFLITGVMDEFNLTLNLPLGAGIVEESKIGVSGMKPFMPEEGMEGSDGRKIFIKWFFVKPRLGQTIEVSAIYEQIFGPEQLLMGVAVMAMMLPIIFAIFFLSRRNRIEQVLPILNEGERAVMKMLLESGGEIDQRKVVKECDISKSKISRIIKDLEERGLITVTKRGRSNKIRMNYRKKEPRHDAEKKSDSARDSKNPGNNPFYSPK